MTSRAALALALVALGCRHQTTGPARRASARGATSPQARADAWPAPADDDALRWTLVAPTGLPTPVRDIGALSGGEAVVVARAGLYRWRENQPEVAVCETGATPADPAFVPTSIQAEGDRFVALNGLAGSPVAWVSENRGESCRRVELPSLASSVGRDVRLGLSLVGRTVLVWSTAGVALRSLDAGGAWQRLPPLEEALEFAPGPDDSVLAAAATDLVGHARIYRWTAGAGAWEPVRGAESRRRPVSFQSVDARTVLVADGGGTLAIDAEGAVRSRRLEPAWRAPEDAPHILAVGGGGRFLASTARTLASVTAEGTAPFAALPGLRPIHAIDASGDGFVWATDGQSLWRGRFDEPLAEVTRRPLPDGRPVAFTARGRDIAIASEAGVVAWSRDDGVHWRRLTVPQAGGNRPLALHIDRRGTLFVMCTQTVSVSDGGEFETLALPRHAQTQAGGTFTTIGDRWVVAQGDVLTSDDRGEHWVHRFGPGDPIPPAAVMGLAAPLRTPVPVAYALHEGPVGYLLDSERNLWRTDDGASTFERVETRATPPSPGPGFFVGAVLGWDGGDRVAVHARGTLLRSRDGGVHFREIEAPFRARFVTFLDDAALVMASQSPHLPHECSGENYAPMMETPAGWLVEPGACARGATFFARDGDVLYALSQEGLLWRVGLRYLARRIAGPAHARP